MFVALRDLRFARVRFVLIGSVVALITVLVGFLSGLTGGLATQNVSAILGLPADRVVFSGDTAASFSDSAITEQQATAWASTSGVTTAEPVGISQTRAETDTARAAIAIFGVQATFDRNAPSRDDTLTLSEPAADALAVSTVDRLVVEGTTKTVYTVAG